MNWLQLKWHKLVHWEYWPFNLIYFPLFPVWVFFAARARSFFFFNAANPSIKNGGMAMESKKEIYDIIPDDYIPKTFLVPVQTDAAHAEKQLKALGMSYPVIAKPDIGMKGFGVDKIKSITDLEDYINRAAGDFLLQEFVPFSREIGLFFVRFPDDEKGMITGIVNKEFLHVVGDGKHTTRELIKQNPRSLMQLSVLEKLHGDGLSNVLEAGKKMILVPYGSHTRGSKFTDESHEINSQMEATFNDICTRIPGFYFGRLDILFDNFEDLSKGEKFKIIEINGAGSEPTHIYDPKHSLLFAWREITRHWNYLNKISIINHKKGHDYLSFKDGRAMLKANNALEEEIKLI